MTRLSLLLFLLLFLFSCNNSSSKKASSKNVGDSIAVAKADTILTTKKTVDTLTRLENIDKENSKTIARDDSNEIRKAIVLKHDSLIWLIANMRLDHRIFGYDKPDTKSKKMILLSIFTMM
jgi:hypothetical protein